MLECKCQLFNDVDCYINANVYIFSDVVPYLNTYVHFSMMNLSLVNFGPIVCPLSNDVVPYLNINVHFAMMSTLTFM